MRRQRRSPISQKVNPDSFDNRVWAATFFWARAVHAVVYWFAVPHVRTLAFAVGYVSIAGIFYEIVR